MLSVIYAVSYTRPLAECHYAECHCDECCYAECRYAECQYVQCHYAECRGATQRVRHYQIFTKLSYILDLSHSKLLHRLFYKDAKDKHSSLFGAKHG